MHCEYRRIVPGAHTAVLMLHGILGSPAHFRRFEPIVPARMSVVNLLLDGHGGRAADFSRTSMQKWKRQVEAEVRELARTHCRIMILGHSMGTLLALHAAQREAKVAGLFLLAPPLKICIRLRALTNAIRLAFDRICEDDPAAAALRDCTSVQLTRCLPVYLGWIPRYVELLHESVSARRGYADLDVPCRTYLSGRDELVSLKSRRWLDGDPGTAVFVLEGSSHSYYTPDDTAFLRTEFARFLSAASETQAAVAEST